MWFPIYINNCWTLSNKQVYSKELLSFLGVAGRMTWSASAKPVCMYAYALMYFLNPSSLTYHSIKSTNSFKTQGSLLSHRRCNVPKSTTCVCPTLQAETMPYRELYALMEAPLRKASRAYPGMFRCIHSPSQHTRQTVAGHFTSHTIQHTINQATSSLSSTGSSTPTAPSPPWSSASATRTGRYCASRSRTASCASSRGCGARYEFNTTETKTKQSDCTYTYTHKHIRTCTQSAIDSHFVSMASINDPIFYASHTYFDRLAHFLALSPELEQRGFNRTWAPATNSRRLRWLRGQEEEEDGEEEVHIHHHPNRAGCLGGAYEDPSPFSHFYFRGAHDDGKRGEEDEDGEREAYHSMREIDTVLHPRHAAMPYVYDDLSFWGGRRWVPKPRAREEEEEGGSGGEN